MKFDLNAIVTREGTVLGQALLSQNFFVAPLHVFSCDLQLKVSFVNARGLHRIASVGCMLANDEISDLAIYKMSLYEPRLGYSRILDTPAVGSAVVVHCIDKTNSMHSGPYELYTIQSRICDIVIADAYAYPMANGRIASLHGVCVYFLEHRFPRGWSGSPIFLRESEQWLGCIHGNASVNNGAGICLPLVRGSIIVETLNQVCNL